MKTYLQLLVACAFILTQYSCTSVLYVNTTLPPDVAVTHDQWKVVAVNRFNPALLPFNREKKLDAFEQGAKEAFYGVTEAILQDDTFVLIAADTTGNYLQTAAKQALTPEQVQSIHAKHPHHLVLALDNFDAYFEQETFREKNGDGSVSKTAHYTLHTRSYWTLYDSTGAVLDRASLTKQELYDSRGVLSGLLAIGQSIANAGPVIDKLAWQTGMDYWKRLQPRHISFARPYYSNKDFTPAAYSMAASDWDKAVILLTPIAESGQRKNAAKAAYNLAVVHEAKGDVARARKWAKLSADKGNKLALLLLSDLNGYH
ncbi:DUF6340 family protein [uncultured Pontibacter sp.]|uniref:DUF6340 family protein n=1 Tax=uncultured Pontibacter sp. TaxID=453356 RepID=UPI0026077D14|nr:DUF6340 family protein [uncultured Pontibacter sp.]